MAGLGGYPAAAVLRAENLDREKRFYTDVLGLIEVAGRTAPGSVFLEAGDGTKVMIYERPGMPAPQNTTLGFGLPASEFEPVVADLRAKGVVFEDYDMPEIGLKTVNGIAEMDGSKAAWFTDPEGNIVNLASM